MYDLLQVLSCTGYCFQLNFTMDLIINIYTFRTIIILLIYNAIFHICINTLITQLEKEDVNMDSVVIRSCVNGILDVAVPISRTDLRTIGDVCLAIDELFSHVKAESDVEPSA